MTGPREPDLRDYDGEEITAARVLYGYLNTNDYDDELGGYVSWVDGKLRFVADAESGPQPEYEWDLPCPDGPPRLTGRSW